MSEYCLKPRRSNLQKDTQLLKTIIKIKKLVTKTKQLKKSTKTK